jgi:hypothetical protein
VYVQWSSYLLNKHQRQTIWRLQTFMKQNNFQSSRDPEKPSVVSKGKIDCRIQFLHCNRWFQSICIRTHKIFKWIR